MFKEVKFNPGVHILEEGNLMNEKFYLIADGHIRLESLKNPYRRREMNKKSLLKNIDRVTAIVFRHIECGRIFVWCFQFARLELMFLSLWQTCERMRRKRAGSRHPRIYR